ncbi:MAG: hypothetical protein RLZZ366_2532 [Pseudomonadota bacterium]|jgi:hypothetical protein
MATQLDPAAFDLEEQLARIQKMRREDEKMSVEISKLIQEIKLATPHVFFQGAVAMAAMIGAGAALFKLLH